MDLICWNIEFDRLESGTKMFENLKNSKLFEPDIQPYIQVCVLRCLHNLSLPDPDIVQFSLDILVFVFTKLKKGL